MEDERWLPAVGFEGLYSVSDRGRVRGEDRFVTSRWGTPKRQRGQILKQHPGPHGYMVVTLSIQGDSRPLFVPSLVLKAFVGPRPDGQETCHYDGVNTNNSASNLRWGTHTSNCADKLRHGTDQRGESHPRAKLNELQVRSILASREPARVFSVMYGIAESVIWKIRKREIWAHIK